MSCIIVAQMTVNGPIVVIAAHIIWGLHIIWQLKSVFRQLKMQVSSRYQQLFGRSSVFGCYFVT